MDDKPIMRDPMDSEEAKAMDKNKRNLEGMSKKKMEVKRKQNKIVSIRMILATIGK